jgi:hypothetical protein
VPRRTLGRQRVQLRQRDLALGGELHRFGHASFAPPLRILRPILRQIQPLRHRHAGLLCDQRDADCHIAVVLRALSGSQLGRQGADRWP